MNYKQITRAERVGISMLLKIGYSHNQIALELNRKQSTISREIKRNSNIDPTDPTKSLLVYNPDYAHKKKKRVRLEVNKQQIKLEFESKKYPNLEKYIIEKLKLKWSPEQIAGRMKKELSVKTCNLETEVSHETIYKYIYNLAPKGLKESTSQNDNQKDKEAYLKQLTLKVELSKNLRHNKGQFNRYRRRHGTRQRAKDRDQLNKKRIDARPAIVETRSRVGDWEGDTIVGLEKNQHILTLVERKSKYLKSKKLNQATAEETKAQIVDIFKSIPDNKKYTQTYDNGVQFSKHESIEEITKVPVYFAYPYHSWERGTNENTNGLLRQYFPKKTPFNNITQKDLDQVVKEINNRPRKTLAYLTPDEVFNHDMKF